MEILTAAILLLAGVGVFLVGVHLLSNNMEQLAGKNIKALFNKTANNRLVNVGIGAATTAIIQSSGVTTVLIVGFVNVGAMSLYQATAMIMGANIGTTVTGLLAAFQSVKWFSLAMQALAFVGMMLAMISGKDVLKKIGYLAAGLGLIFIGLDVMSSSMSSIKGVIGELFKIIDNPFLLFTISALLTALAQSSSATTSIIITLAAAGITIGDGGNSVLYLILGVNLGSCVTALMSSIGANANARRTSLIHFMFNLFGDVLFFVMLMLIPNFNQVTFQSWFPGAEEFQIAMFHVFFNVTCTVIFLPLCKYFVKISTILIKDKKEQEESVTYLDNRIINNTALAVEQSNKETMLLADTAIEAFNLGYTSFKNKDTSLIDEVHQKIETCNKINKRITDYLIKLSAVSGYENEKKISDIHNNVGDVMRIAEIADNLTKYTTRMVDDDLNFSEQVMKDLGVMFDKIQELYSLVKQVILNKEVSLIDKVDSTEDQIDAMRKTLIDSHIERLNSGACKPENSSVFINLVSNLERLGDHLTYIAYTEKQ